jgi:hypothetical protein
VEYSSDFNNNKKLAETEDYSFNIYYTPSTTIVDSLRFTIESNVGQLVISLPVKKGTVQNIYEDELANIQIYPNPATDYIRIANPGKCDIRFVSIVDGSGKTISIHQHTPEYNRIDVSAFKNGIYFVYFVTETQKGVRKLIINH